jgi:SRSO17 transposase
MQNSIPFIEKFLSHFQTAFSKKQMSIFRQLIYAMFHDYKRLSLASLAHHSNINYQKLQYFFSESSWDINQLNAIRLNILNSQITTRPSPKSVLAIDDTSCPKPHAQKTEGAQFQYCGSLGREENCNVAVASCFVSDSKHCPLNFKSYIPDAKPQEFKSKLDLAKELILDAINQNLSFLAIVFDAWYTASDLIEFIASQGRSLIAEIKMNRLILWTDPTTKQRVYKRADHIIPLIKQFFPHKLKPVFIPQANGKTKSVFTYCLQSNLKDCSTKLNILFVFDKWSDSDDKDVHALITNNLTFSPETIIKTYLLRWGIEESFRELKDNFAFDQYQVRHQEQIQRHWILAFLAWSLTYWIKNNGCLSKIIDHPPQSIGQCKEALASLLIIDSAFLLSKNPDALKFFGIKSQNFIHHLKN